MDVKFLLVRPGPTFSVQDVAFGWRDGLRELGVNVADMNFDDRLDFYSSAHIDRSAGEGEWIKAFDFADAMSLANKSIESVCYEFWPDVVLVVSGHFVRPHTLALMRARGHHVVLLCTESPYEDDRQLAFCEYADTVLLNDPVNLEMFRARHPDVHYVPHAYNPAIHHPGAGTPELKSDFAFVGTGFRSRIEFFEAVDFDGLDVILGGAWVALDDDSPLVPLIAHRRDWCMDNTDTAEVYRSTRSSLNLYRREAREGEGAHADGVAMGPREVELAACETFFIRDPRPESDDVLSMLPTFSEPAEVRPLLDWWLAHDREREDVAARARAAVVDRTFRNNAEWLVRHLTKG